MSNWKTIVRNPKNLGAIRSTLRGGGIAKRGIGVALKGGGRAALRFGGGRTDLLEELGRVEAERSNPNRRAEISRVHGELNRGYAKGGRAGHLAGGVIKKVIQGGKKIISKIKGKGEKGLGSGIKPSEMHEIIPKGDRKLYLKEKLANPHKRIGKAAGGWTTVIPRTLKKLDFPGDRTGKPHSSREGRRDSWVRGARRAAESAKKIKEKMKPKRPSPQPLAKGGKADKKWIQKAVNPKHKGYCTPMTKKTCTPARKALARTFKKKAKTGWG